MSPHAAFTNGSPPHSLEMFWWHILFCRFKRTLSSWVQITGIAHNPITCNLLPLPNSTDYVLPPPGGRAKMHPLSSLYSVLLLHKMIAHPSTQIKFVCPTWMSVQIGIPMNVPLSCSWGWLIVGQSELSDLRAAIAMEQKSQNLSCRRKVGICRHSWLVFNSI